MGEYGKQREKRKGRERRSQELNMQMPKAPSVSDAGAREESCGSGEGWEGEGLCPIYSAPVCIYQERK